MDSKRNVFLYWIGNDYKLIKILRDLIYSHSKNGIAYKVHLITHENLNNYIKNLPKYFFDLTPAHQADYARVNVICDYGGIWLDSDTLVLDSLDSLFAIFKKYDGFFILENNKILCNGVFGSKPNTPLMKIWKNKIIEVLEKREKNIEWTEIGNNILDNLDKSYYNNYKIFKGLDTLYPVNWDQCISEFIEKPYDNYKNLIRNYQPLIILVNSVYKNLENLSIQEILNGNMPLNYFINKSFDNLKENYNTMSYKINPAKATCENLGFGDGIQAVNENCFGICAAFSGTEDTFEMDPQCVKSCEELVEKKRREMFGVGRCDHQAPYRAVFWGQVPRFIPTLLKQGYDLDTAKTMCNKMCEDSSLVNECRQKCKLDSDAVMVDKDNIETNVENKNIEKYEKSSNYPYSNTKQDIKSNNTIKSESEANKIEKSPTLTILLIFIAIIVILILISFVKKRK